MNTSKRYAQIFATISLIALTASQASAKLCFAQKRAFPSNASDGVDLHCGTVGGTATVGRATAVHVGGNKTLTATKTAGVAIALVGAEGFDVFGTIVCSVNDSTSSGGGKNTLCPTNTTDWQGSASY